MTATIEQEVEQRVREEVQAFEMPRPSMGQTVAWYPSGIKGGACEVAHVLKVSKRNLLLQRISGTCVETVRHVDDPKLKLSAEQRESGAWDFTDYDKQQAADRSRVAEIEARVKTLEELLDSPKKSK